MGLSFGLLAACVTMALSQSSHPIKDSSSLDLEYFFVAKSTEKGITYQVERKNGTSASDELVSDFGTLRSLDTASDYTSIHWRLDDKFVVASTDHDRHHIDFFILGKTTEEFRVIPFDWEQLIKFAHLDPLGFGYPRFLKWLPDGHAVVDIFEQDGRNTIRETRFNIVLSEKVTPVSWTIQRPENKL